MHAIKREQTQMQVKSVLLQCVLALTEAHLDEISLTY